MGSFRRAAYAAVAGVACAGLGAWLGQRLGGKPDTAGLGAAIGAVSGAFAPSVAAWLTGRTNARARASGMAVLPHAVERPSRLLDPARGVVEFTGREGELAELIAWSENGEAVRVRLLTGAGGLGKTRLALQLADRLREVGWTCHFIGDQQEAGALEAARAATSGRLLLVVDYAETRIGLPALLRAAVDDSGMALRVLLLARSGGQWWDQLGAGEPAVRDLIAANPSGGYPLPLVLDQESADEDLIRQAMSRFAAEIGVEIPGEVSITPSPARSTVLELHATALAAVLESASSAPMRSVKVDAVEVMRELLRHEERFWIGTAKAQGLLNGPAGLTTTALRQIVAAACLLGASDEAGTLDVIGRVPGAPRAMKVVTWLRELYPSESQDAGRLGVLGPDRLAGFHTVTELGKSEELARRCLSDLSDRQARNAVIMLARASGEHESAGDYLGRLLPLVSQVITGLEAPRETLISIANAIPYPSVALATASVAVNRRILELTPAEAHPAEHARRLSALSLALSQAGNYEEADSLEREAVSAWRDLSGESVRLYRADLAASLVNLGLWHSEIGLWQEAVEAAEESVGIFREEIVDHPELLPDLATALGNLGSRLSDLERAHEALAAEEEAVAIRRELAAEAPELFLGDLGISLANLGNRLSDVGRWADALRVSEEAVTTFRDLTASDPDRFRDALATALFILARRREDVGADADAVQAGEEALAIRRELARDYPDRYMADLARTLNNLSIQYSSAGQPGKALEAAEEAVAIRRPLADAQPDRFREDLASSLVNIGIWLSESARLPEALAPAQEGTAIYRQLASANHERYKPNLARALGNLGVAYKDLNRPSDAVVVEREAYEMFRELASGNPRRYQPELARSLGNLGNRLWELGDRTDALAVGREAADVHRELAAIDSDRYNPDLAASLRGLGVWYSDTGQPAEALPLELESVELYRSLAASKPQYTPELAGMLRNLAITYSELGRPPDAERCRAEADQLQE